MWTFGPRSSADQGFASCIRTCFAVSRFAFWVWGLGSGFWGLGFGFWVLGFGIWGFRVPGSRFRVHG